MTCLFPPSVPSTLKSTLVLLSILKKNAGVREVAGGSLQGKCFGFI